MDAHDDLRLAFAAAEVAGELRGTTEVAVVASPALRRCWWATRGEGSCESSWPRRGSETRRLAVSTTATLADAALAALDDASRARLPPSGDRAPVSPLRLVELVRGEIDAVLVERYHARDHAPWVLPVEEAGGRFTNRAGGRAADRGGGLYSNAAPHGRLLAALGYPARP
ncbi:inositol monophosphatase family protein [Geodermatophilus tzadiensis]|uniref:Inositol monophosphatase family protein n=1 Tax=Geodermatophilus tzadiensis TaxID=1137988 RepID=A0A2T0TXR7_9ACTN|nr:inositol monophosphatase family protein [Geodermatophilus tzadiensis]PRY50464.1 inositol monophosphatase family protein [Geodermatophilus tzadiensis]